MAYRISMFKDVGVPNADDGRKIDMDWGQYFAVAKQLKAKGKPFGQALGHSTGDPPAFCYPYMWSNGAMEVDKDGKTVIFNKPEFVDAMRRFIQAWKDGYDETGTSWDDSNNNRAYLSHQISSTFNGSSIYFAAKRNNPDIAADTHHMLIPRGPAGRFYWLGSRTFAILKSSKNIAGAKEFLKWWFQDKQYEEWWRLQEGYHLQPTKKLAADPMWDKDPKMAPFRDQPKYGRDLGYAGPPNEKASLAYSKYIIVDTFAKAVQGGDAKAAVDWGADQLKRIYEG
jgi:multiple sugar transport system substrate-binding protein